jgi:hypothetical protein
MHVVDVESSRPQPIADELRARAVRFARRIDRRKANQRADQFDEFGAPFIDGFE